MNLMVAAADINERFVGIAQLRVRLAPTVDRQLRSHGLSQATWATIAIAARDHSPLFQRELADRCHRVKIVAADVRKQFVAKLRGVVRSIKLRFHRSERSAADVLFPAVV
jgi:hypothetical protein